MLPITLLQETLHHSATSEECNGFPWKIYGFSAPHVMLFSPLNEEIDFQTA